MGKRIFAAVAGMLLAVEVLVGPAFTWASESSSVDSGDTAWLLVSTALVMLMTPGLALFYGGMARKKNVLNTIMLSFVTLCLVSVQWVLWGYSLAFGPDLGGIIGGLDFLGLRGVGLDPQGGQSIPHQLFMMFQGMFAMITPALITGALVERMKFSSFLIFLAAWCTLVYDPLAHWIWGKGWLADLGALDFAGGTVVHISSGVSALAACLILGSRRGMGAEPMHPNNLPMTITGGALLWFGWFGFNAGSALAAGGIATNALVVTHTASAMAACTWMAVEWLHRGKPTALGTVTGAVAGLVAITPAAGYVGVGGALAIGIGAGVMCYMAVVKLKPKLGYDDSLDVFGVHGVGGTWGALATGLFATGSIPGSSDGLLAGNPHQFLVQLLATAVTWVLSFGLTTGILLAVKAVVGLRVTEEEEMVGLDLSVHGERGYSMDFAEGAMTRSGAVAAQHLAMPAGKPAPGPSGA